MSCLNTIPEVFRLFHLMAILCLRKIFTTKSLMTKISADTCNYSILFIHLKQFINKKIPI